MRSTTITSEPMRLVQIILVIFALATVYGIASGRKPNPWGTYPVGSR